MVDYTVLQFSFPISYMVNVFPINKQKSTSCLTGHRMFHCMKAVNITELLG
jgi:hypothetical protein